MVVGGYTKIVKNKIDVDYSPWLGPDWKPTWEKKKASMLICNHTSWIDIFFAMHEQRPSFVARAGVRDIPWVGKFASFLKAIYVDRSSTGSRSNTSDMVIAHQKRYLERKENTQVLIYPEA